MYTRIKSIDEIVNDLTTNHNNELTLAEKYSIAIEIQRNQIIENAFSVSSDNSEPPALEAIALALGYK